MTLVELECRYEWDKASIGVTDTSAVERECRRAWWVAAGWHQMRQAQHAALGDEIARLLKPKPGAVEYLENPGRPWRRPWRGW